MTKPPAFQFYTGDWFAGTRLMSHAEKGAYIDMLAAQWDSGPFLDNAEVLRKAMGATPADFRRLWPVLEAKFPRRSDGRRANERLEKVRAKLEARREAGGKGGDSKWHGKPDGKPIANTSETGMANGCSQSLSQSLSERQKPFASRRGETPGSERRRDESQGMTHISVSVPKEPAA